VITSSDFQLLSRMLLVRVAERGVVDHFVGLKTLHLLPRGHSAFSPVGLRVEGLRCPCTYACVSQHPLTRCLADIYILCGSESTPPSPPTPSTEGPPWRHSRLVLGAIKWFLEPFCGHLSPKIDKVSEELTLRYPHEEPCVGPPKKIERASRFPFDRQTPIPVAHYHAQRCNEAVSAARSEVLLDVFFCGQLFVRHITADRAIPILFQGKRSRPYDVIMLTQNTFSRTLCDE